MKQEQAKKLIEQLNEVERNFVKKIEYTQREFIARMRNFRSDIAEMFNNKKPEVIPDEAKTECKACRGTGTTWMMIGDEPTDDYCENCNGRGFTIKETPCKFCADLDELHFEAPDDPHHGETAECSECGAEFYKAYEQDIMATNDEAVKSHPELKRL